MVSPDSCPDLFVSPANGYFYCGRRDVKRNLGYSPYCAHTPAGSSSAFSCPVDAGKYEEPKQLKLEEFTGEG